MSGYLLVMGIMVIALLAVAIAATAGEGAASRQERPFRDRLEPPAIEEPVAARLSSSSPPAPNEDRTT